MSPNSHSTEDRTELMEELYASICGVKRAFRNEEDGHEGDRRGLHKYIVDRQLVKMQTLVDWQQG